MLEVHSWTDESTGDMKIILGEKGPEKARIVFNLATGKSLHLQLGQRVPEEFIITIPWNIAQEVMNALAGWLARKGIRNDFDAKMEGTLAATRRHLEDLRELLKLTPLHLYKVDSEGNLIREDPKKS